jgi:hypothetical protein
MRPRYRVKMSRLESLGKSPIAHSAPPSQHLPDAESALRVGSAVHSPHHRPIELDHMVPKGPWSLQPRPLQWVIVASVCRTAGAAVGAPICDD